MLSPIFEPDLSCSEANLAQLLLNPIRAPLWRKFPREILTVPAGCEKKVFGLIMVQQPNLVSKQERQLQDALTFVPVVAHFKESELSAFTEAVESAHPAQLVYVVRVLLILHFLIRLKHLDNKC